MTYSPNNLNPFYQCVSTVLLHTSSCVIHFWIVAKVKNWISMTYVLLEEKHESHPTRLRAAGGPLSPIAAQLVIGLDVRVSIWIEMIRVVTRIYNFLWPIVEYNHLHKKMVAATWIIVLSPPNKHLEYLSPSLSNFLLDTCTFASIRIWYTVTLLTYYHC